MPKIYIVIGIAYEETCFEKAFMRKDMAEVLVDKLNAEQDGDYYWYRTEEMELIE